MVAPFNTPVKEIVADCEVPDEDLLTIIVCVPCPLTICILDETVHVMDVVAGGIE